MSIDREGFLFASAPTPTATDRDPCLERESHENPTAFYRMRWDIEGAVIEQDLAHFGAAEWDEMVAEDPGLATWSVISVGDGTVFAMQPPPGLVGRPIG